MSMKKIGGLNKMNKSYFEILNELKNTVDTDEGIPLAIKENIEAELNNLFEILWPYSD